MLLPSEYVLKLPLSVWHSRFIYIYLKSNLYERVVSFFTFPAFHVTSPMSLSVSFLFTVKIVNSLLSPSLYFFLVSFISLFFESSR